MKGLLQTIVGVGVLVLGTPLLLILNYNMIEIMNLLLPISIKVISGYSSNHSWTKTLAVGPREIQTIWPFLKCAGTFSFICS